MDFQILIVRLESQISVSYRIICVKFDA